MSSRQTSTYPTSSESTPWQTLAGALRQTPTYRSLRDRGGEVVRLPLPAAAWICELLKDNLSQPLLVVVPHEVNAFTWLEAVELFVGAGRATYFPAPSLSPYHEAEISLLVRAEEALALDRIASGDATTIITTPRALFRRLPHQADFLDAVFEICPEEEHPIDQLVERLTKWGYHRSDLVFETGQFAIRGGVFDFFPPGQPMPIRLDLFGDTVESIRRFEPESQRSLETLPMVRVLPLSLFPKGESATSDLADLLTWQAGPEMSEEVAGQIEKLRQEGGFDGWEHYLPVLADETRSLLDYLPHAKVITVDQATLGNEIRHHQQLLQSEFENRANQGRLAVPPEMLEHPAEELTGWVEGSWIRLGDLLVESKEAIDFAARSTDIMQDQLQRFEREVETANARGERLVLVVPDEHRVSIADLLEGRDIPIGSDGVELASGELQRGFHIPSLNLTLFGERQLLRRSPLSRQKKKKKRRFGPFLSSLRDLKVGDYVVHVDHGIGQFVGLRKIGESTRPGQDLPPELAGFSASAAETEVMEINYASGKNLLLPLSRLDQVQKYSGIEGVAPRLDRLGGTSWNRTKSRIKKGMRDMAQELLKLYAARQMAQAPRMDGETDLQAQFEAAFEHEETPDQLEAISEIYQDLRGDQPMDRLLCGDVGFGKTEVSMRAAFKAVDNGFQVAVLAPTTILADQHLATFRQRFKNFPITIDMVSRFRSQGEVKEIYQKVEASKVDILIGTHRLLSKKLKFAKLGLLIVDEEQRFGVAHKEHIKQLRKDVHVLAMSATPVPRTLQLSLAGVRDLSLIETPPRDRMAVETAILPFEPQLIREAIEFELERQGQVYYVYNRVETIDRMATMLKEIMPGLKVTVGHGQLPEGELAKRMHAFIDGEYDVLLATTIIENGIDIPNVNTMIVHRADRFGLSQLYQLRGRVGRSDQLAYCYLLVSGDKVMSQEARKRLDAIREFTELGAGFRVAGRDLEIRGAGNLLGAEQSGHIAAVGIETYLKMLEETVAELRGESLKEPPSITLDLPVDMSIPEDYVGDANLRMEIYQRLASGEEPELKVIEELRDRFGPPPVGVKNLVEVAALKRLAESLFLQGISGRGGRLVLRLRQDARIEPDRLVELLAQSPDARFSPSGSLTLERVSGDRVIRVARQTLEFLATPTAGPEETHA